MLCGPWAISVLMMCTSRGVRIFFIVDVSFSHSVGITSQPKEFHKVLNLSGKLNSLRGTGVRIDDTAILMSN